MYLLLLDSGSEIRWDTLGNTWIIFPFKHMSFRYDVDVLDYSDWSIQRISINVLMNAIQCGDLSVSDFCNLTLRDKFYRVTVGYVLTGVGGRLIAKGITLLLRDDCSGLEIRLADGRCLCLSCLRTNNELLVVNYKETFKCDSLSSFRVHDLIPYLDGYRLKAMSDLKLYLDQKHFVVEYKWQAKKFLYVRESELARRKLIFNRD